MRELLLKEVCDVQMGQSPPGSSYNGEQIGLPLLGGASDFGDIYPEAKKFTNEPGKTANKGDLILCIRATIGDRNWADKEYCLGRGVAGLRPKINLLDSHYLWHWLEVGKKQLLEKANGSTFKQVTRNAIGSCKIPVPPIEEQKRIAAILDKADRIRRKRQEAIRLTEELGRSIFLDMFGDPVTNPKGWDLCSIQDLCSIIVDCPHSTPKYLEDKNGYPCIRTSDLQNGYLDFSTTKHVGDMEYQNRVSRHIPVSGDILYSREGERFGIAARVRENLKLCLGQRMMLFQPDFSKATSAFLWSLLNSQSVYHQATQSVGGSTSPHVNVKDIKKFKAFCPPLEMQVVLENTENRLDSLRDKNIQDIAESENLFNSLLQRAFRGEL
jgi:type I restriction enzyme, S subunit